MASNVRIIFATVYPRRGKLHRIVELYQGVIKHAIDKEPGCLEFQLFVEMDSFSGEEQLFTIERFKNEESMKNHEQGATVAAWNDAVSQEDLLDKPSLVFRTKPTSGFVL